MYLAEKLCVPQKGTAKRIAKLKAHIASCPESKERLVQATKELSVVLALSDLQKALAESLARMLPKTPIRETPQKADSKDEMPVARVLYCGGQRWSNDYFKSRKKPSPITLNLGIEILGFQLQSGKRFEDEVVRHTPARKRNQKAIAKESEQSESEWIDDLRRFLEEHENEQVVGELHHKEVEEFTQQWLIDFDRC
jgi:hypothetical protein